MCTQIQNVETGKMKAFVHIGRRAFANTSIKNLISKIHNLITAAPNLVVLVSTISLWCVDYYYVVYSYVWCDVNFAFAMLSVLLRLA